MKRIRTFLSVLLVLSMLFQPFVPVFAKNSNTAEVSSAEKEFLDAYEQISALEEIDISEVELLVKACTVGENMGHGIVNGAKWLYNGFDKLVGGGKHQVEYDEYKDYVGQIEEANRKIIEAKAQAKCMKSAFDAGGIDAAKNADPSKVGKGSLETQLKAMDDARTALTDAGNCLKEVAGAMSTIAKVFSGLGTVLDLIALIPGAASVCAPIGLAFSLAGDILAPCAACLDSAGDGLIAAAQKGAHSEAGTYAMDNIKHTAIEEAPKAALNIALDVAGSDLTGSSNVIKDTSSKFLGEATEIGAEAAGKLWDPTKSFVGDVFKVIGESRGWSKPVYENASKLFVSVPRALNTFSDAFTGKKLYENPIKGVKQCEKELVGGISGFLADQLVPLHEPDVNYEGDDDD